MKEDGILGFNIGETEKTITVQTITDVIKESEETFYIRLRTNSPVDDSDIITMFTNNIGKGTIIEKDLKEPYNPYPADPVNPFEPFVPPSEDNFPDDPPGDDGSGDDTGIDPTPTYTVVANRTTCPEDAFIIYTITTTNVKDGSISLNFSPHAVEMIRGIQSTIHIFLDEDYTSKDIWQIYLQAYKEEPFIRLVREKSGIYRYPEPKLVLGTNMCEIGFEKDESTGRLIVMSAIDNLMKGAAGQGVQSMNIALGFEETAGINSIGFHPV